MSASSQEPGASTGSPPLVTPRPESAARTSARRAVRTAREAAPRSLGLPARVGTRRGCSCAPRVAARRAQCQDTALPAERASQGLLPPPAGEAPGAAGSGAGPRARFSGFAPHGWPGGWERAANKIFPGMGSPPFRQTGPGKQATRTFQRTGSPGTLLAAACAGQMG